jgi:hypothetical protein
MIQGVDKRIVPLASEIRAATVVRTMVRGQRLARAQNIGAGLPKIFIKAKRKVGAFNKMVGTKQEEAARRITRAVDSSDPRTILNGIAALPVARGFAPLREWIIKASRALGVEPTETEQVMASASTAKQIGMELPKLPSKRHRATPPREPSCKRSGWSFWMT